MANGSAALHLVPAPESENTSAPRAGIETAIGDAMANATETLAASMADLDAGGLTAANRTRGGETVARVVELQLAMLGEMPDFGAVALAAGRRAIFARHGVTLRQHCGAVPETALDGLLTHVLAVANKVAAIEMAYRAH
jgi:hypothetical protein